MDIIPIGKTVRAKNIGNEQNLLFGDIPCSERIVLCQEAQYDQQKPNILIYEVANAKCCNYNGKEIEFDETIIDAEVNNYYFSCKLIEFPF